MAYPKDNTMIGRKFGRLLVLKEAGRKGKGNITYECMCECGKTKVVRGDNLRLGHTKSCGCLHSEKSRKNIIKAINHGRYIHD